jgi:sec-independent protein translocase protein TatB
MFGMGFTEILFIAVIAILFLGPEKLPQAMVDIARFFKKLKGTIADTKEELERELQISDLKAEMLSYKSQLDEMTNDVKDVTSGQMLQSEIDDINKAVMDANPEAEISKVDKELKNGETAKPKEPARETVTFEKKKTPIKKADKADDKYEDA